MVLIFIAILLINSGLTSGQSCTGACSMTYASSSYEHLDQPTLVCGDLANLQNCIKDLTCITQVEKSQLIESTRDNLIQRKNISCEISVCNSTLIDKCYRLFSPMDTCGSFNQAYYCFMGLSCPESERQQIINEAKTKLPGTSSCEILTTTTKTTTTITASQPVVTAACTNSLVLCSMTFSMTTMSRDPDKDYGPLCGDLDNLIKCAGAANCPESERKSIIDEGINRLAGINIDCSKPPISTTPSTCNKEVITKCSTTFGMNLGIHSNNRTLACKDLDDFNSCISVVQCGADDTTKSKAISDSNKLLNNFGITCSTTTSTTKISSLSTTTTQPDTACTTSLETCSMDFFMTTMTRDDNRELLCGDLNTLKQCVGAANCPTSEKQTAINDAEERLSSKGINCNTATTAGTTPRSAPTTTTPTATTTASTTTTPPANNAACSGSLDTCSVNFVMTTMSRDFDPFILCRDLNTLKQCVGAANCPTSDKQTTIRDGEERLLSIGVNCSGPVPIILTTPKPVVTTVAPEVIQCNSSNSDNNINQTVACLQTYDKGLRRHGSNTNLVCKDVTDFVNCMNKINCLDEEYRVMLITAVIEQKDAEGLKCGLTTPTTTLKTTTSLKVKTTVATVTTDIGKQPPISEDCPTSTKRCELDYNSAVASRVQTKETVCSDVQKYVSCMLSLSVCNYTEAYKDQLRSNAQDMLNRQNVPCIIKNTPKQAIYTDDTYNGGRCARSAITFLAVILILILKN